MHICGMSGLMLGQSARRRGSTQGNGRGPTHSHSQSQVRCARARWTENSGLKETAKATAFGAANTHRCRTARCSSSRRSALLVLLIQCLRSSFCCAPEQHQGRVLGPCQPACCPRRGSVAWSRRPSLSAGQRLKQEVPAQGARRTLPRLCTRGLARRAGRAAAPLRRRVPPPSGRSKQHRGTVKVTGQCAPDSAPLGQPTQGFLHRFFESSLVQI